MQKDWLEATKAGDLQRVLSLLEAGADIDSLDHYGQTALMNAVLSNDFELTQLLVAQGAKLDHAAKYRLSALMLAIINQRVEMVQLLVEAGANGELEGSYGEFACTPLAYAERHGFYEISNILKAHT